MTDTRLASWDLPALLSEGTDPRAKSRRRHHHEFLEDVAKKESLSKPPVKPEPKKAPAAKPKA
jgi:hypothetical protein